MDELQTYQTVTSNFKVDQHDNVYDENGYFYCKWQSLSDEEKTLVKQNPASFY